MPESLRGYPSAATYAAIGVQFGVALPLLAETLRHPTFRQYFFYYGVVIVVLPFALEALSGQWLHPLQRLALVAGPAAHTYGVLLKLYGQFRWWDVVTHGLSAGLLAAGAYLFVLVVRGEGGGRGWRFHAVPFLVVLVGGIGWEVYESIVPWLIVYGPLDTARDIVVDLLAWVVVSRTYATLLGTLPAAVRERFAD